MRSPHPRISGPILSLVALLLAASGAACAADPPADTPAEPTLADVVSVRATGAPGAYRFEVGIESPDVDCDRYADWWEIVTPEGELVHRRVLAHPHAREQPFVRAGGPVEIAADTVVRIRAHMHPGGYGGRAWEGSPRSGFRPLDELSEKLSAGFAAGLERESPQPPPCPR